MQTVRIKLKLKSTFITDWQSDTLFGHLCWVVMRSEGEDGLKEFLQPFMERRPPFLLSNGFPGDWLPSPLSAGAILARAGESGTEHFDRMRKIKKMKYLLW